MNSSIGAGLILAGLLFAGFGGVIGVVSGLTRRVEFFPWVRRAAVAFFFAMLLANLTMVYALVTHDFSVGYVAQVGSRQTPLVFTIVSLWSALEGSILFWGVILGAYILAFVLAHRKDQARFVTIATGVMLLVGVFFAFLIAGPAHPFLPTPPPVPLDGPGPNPLLQNHILMVVHPPFLYLGYVGMTVPFGLAVAGLLAGEIGESWMAPLRRWTMVPWLFLSIGIILGAWWAYAVLGWGGYWAWDPVENASFLPWLTATAFMHSTMVQERRKILRLWTISLALVSFWLTILGTFMTRSGVFNSVHAFTQSSIGPTFLVFLAIVAILSIILMGARGHLLTAQGGIKSLASREMAMFINNLVFSAFTFVVLIGTVHPLISEGLFNKKVTVGEPYFNFFAGPLGLAILFLMGVGPALPWGSGDKKKILQGLLVPGVVGLVFGGLAFALGFKDPLPMLTFVLAGFVATITLREMFLPAFVRVKEKGESLGSALAQSISRSRRRFGGYVVHLGVVVIIVAVAASRAYVVHTQGTLDKGETIQIAGYTVGFEGLEKGREPHRDWIGAKLAITTPSGEADTLLPKMNFYERRTDPIGTPAVRSVAKEDLYVSMMAFDENANNASIKLWVFPLVGWIWWSIPMLAVGTLISLWPSRRAKVALPAATPEVAAGAPPSEVNVTKGAA